MSKFVHSAVSDMQAGRDSWRVILTLCLPAFVLAVAKVLATA